MKTKVAIVSVLLGFFLSAQFSTAIACGCDKKSPSKSESTSKTS